MSPRKNWLLLSCLGTVGLALLWLFNPAEISFLPPCLFHKLTTLHCPGCGATRVCHALVRGEFALAFDKNPLFLIGLPFLSYFFLRSAWTGITKNENYQMPTASASWLVPLAFVVIAYGVARNLPFPAFSWMAP
ncbi:MAG: DUF2752 domain-containing protein [Opitutales bacterium]